MDLESSKCWDTSKVSALAWQKLCKNKTLKYIWWYLDVVSSLVDKGLVKFYFLVQNEWLKSKTINCISGLLEDYSALGLPKPWCCIWGLEHFSIVCLHKHIC